MFLLSTLALIAIFLVGFFPVFMVVGYFLYRLFKMFKPLKKKVKQEKQKFYFYNLVLPSMIYIPLYILVGYLAYGDINFFLDIVGIGFLFGIFYPVYHLFYFIMTYPHRYYGNKISWLIFTTIFIMDFICLFIWASMLYL